MTPEQQAREIIRMVFLEHPSADAHIDAEVEGAIVDAFAAALAEHGREIERLKGAISVSHPDVASDCLPRCPACGSLDGVLGTSGAYFICQACKQERYWTLDHAHPGNWPVAIRLSPWGRKNEGMDALRAQRDALVEALDRLYRETVDYITINHLGDPHHNQSMKMARAALAAGKGEQ